ncbi:protealysin inhibitor emfourin [Aeromicrobium fastidiosum]|uniref:Uncharacterized protein n=1 Tax=Aeromicrobium fastidiosum TaxID=52699 RepID=A0A641AMB3_9ACTN|nr:protealysin inhibitor emfourin [Aeromicrobium fastidiosum]KAA1378420.1 hypothetical protein ESP62_008685 [Aeromicrobium fastidiosum]MBP2392618.1 hypothetical protein [Aeromicrobium fastidiosum]
MDELPFVITVARTGGFAGLRREWSIEVAVPQDADRWRPIVEACPWDDLDGDRDVTADGFVYAVSVADHAAVVPERELDGPWRQLVDEVRRSAEA